MLRRQVLPLLGAALAAPASAWSQVTLPLSIAFRGRSRFDALAAKAARERWAGLPIGTRMVRVGRELRGTPYENFTLEIHDKVESPSVNLQGLDCWTFFEICLGFARMIGWHRPSYGPEDLLREIEFTRYRGGVCHGNYLDRIHYLAEWYFENEARGVAEDITRELGGAERVRDREVCEMTKLWKSYRYLKHNPDLLPAMARHEDRIERLPVYHIPKHKVARIESRLRDGDIIGIVTKHDGGFCSHVGLMVRTSDGVARFTHASRDYRKVVIDKSVSGYLAQYSKHAGIMVARPKEVGATVRDPGEYRRNLRKLGAA